MEKKETKATKYKCFNLVNRKSTYKDCILCKNLFKNTCHDINAAHNINGYAKSSSFRGSSVPAYFIEFKNRAP